MSVDLIKKVNDEQKKSAVVNVKSGDTVRVHQKIKEGNKERIQMFEGGLVVWRYSGYLSHRSHGKDQCLQKLQDELSHEFVAYQSFE